MGTVGSSGADSLGRMSGWLAAFILPHIAEGVWRRMRNLRPRQSLFASRRIKTTQEQLQLANLPESHFNLQGKS
jgi:hypothetical protein